MLILNYFIIFITTLACSSALANNHNKILIDKKSKHSMGPFRLEGEKKSIPFKSKVDFGIKKISIGQGQHGSIDVRIYYSNGINSPLYFLNDDDQCVDRFGILNEYCSLDIATHDFDNDGVHEIVISLGEGINTNRVYIAQYFPPRNIKHSDRDENWKITSFYPVDDTYLSGDSISFRVGSSGFTETYFFKNHEFYKSKN